MAVLINLKHTMSRRHLLNEVSRSSQLITVLPQFPGCLGPAEEEGGPEDGFPSRSKTSWQRFEVSAASPQEAWSLAVQAPGHALHLQRH